MKHIAAAIIIIALTAGADARTKRLHCTFDRATVGVTPCGADHPNVAPSGQRPPGDPVYWSNGVLNPHCSYAKVTATLPGQPMRTGRGVLCSN